MSDLDAMTPPPGPYDQQRCGMKHECARQIGGLTAARYAYASEFPLNEDGEPDVGNIHANIRAMKQEMERLEAFIARAFDAHPNLDHDIAALEAKQ